MNACPGALDEWPDYTHQTLDDGSRVTSMCADGYAGPLCASCASGFYQADRVCRTCGIDVDDRRELIVVSIGAGLFIFAVAVGVAFLDSVKLARLIQAVLTLQQASALAGTAGNLLQPDIARVLTELSFLNFSVQFLKPVRFAFCASV